MSLKHGAHYSKEEATVNSCRHCGSHYMLTVASKAYCSESCRKNAYKVRQKAKKPSPKRIKRLKKKLNKLAVSSFGQWLAYSCNRSGTVEILQGHNKETLHELYQLKRRASKFSEFEEGIIKDRYELSHIFPANSHPEYVGLLTPKNLVIAPGTWNRRNNALPIDHDPTLVVHRRALSKRWMVEKNTSPVNVLKKIRRYLGKPFDDWLSSAEIPLSLKQQLIKALAKVGETRLSDRSLSQLRCLAHEHEMTIGQYTKSLDCPLDVIELELNRLGTIASSVLQRVVKMINDIEASFDDPPPVYAKYKSEIECFVVEQALRHLHRQSYTLSHEWTEVNSTGEAQVESRHILEFFPVGRPDECQQKTLK